MPDSVRITVTASQAKAGVQLTAGKFTVLTVLSGFELHTALQFAGETPLAQETVSIVDPDTGEEIARVQADDAGVVHAQVPDQKDYEFHLVPPDDEDPDALPTPDPAGGESDHALLAVALLDKDGNPLANESLKLAGEDGDAVDVSTDENGHLKLAVEPGAYTISVRGVDLIAHSLNEHEVEGATPPYEFTVNA